MLVRLTASFIKCEALIELKEERKRISYSYIK